jgi:RsmE family RNA methyltransferase
MNFLYFAPHQRLNEKDFLLNQSQSSLDRFKNNNPDFIYKFTTDQGLAGLGKIISRGSDRILRMESITKSYSNLSHYKINIHFQRPQTAKKILHLTGCFGIGELVWFESDPKKNKAYELSPTYKPESMEQYRIEGKEQSGNPYSTKIQIQWNRSELQESRSCILDPKGEISIRESSEVFHSYTLGRESGFTQVELSKFRDNGIPVFHLGKTILRTEYAFSILLHELESKISSHPK